MKAILFGFKGSGKSTLGNALFLRFGIRHIETDHLVEKAAGMPIRALIQLKGEALFRSIEREVILSLKPEEAILSLGGGSLRNPHSLAHVKQLGPLFHIRCPKEVVKMRVLTPPLPTYLDPNSPEEDFEKIYSTTMNLYERIESVEFIPTTLEESCERLWQAINSATYFGSPLGANRTAKQSES